MRRGRYGPRRAGATRASSSPEGFWYSHTIPEAERTRALATIQHSAAAETTSAAAETTSAAANTTSAAAETTAAAASTSTPITEDQDPTGGFRGDRAFASAADEADWDEQNVDNASEEAGPLPYCFVPIPMDDENPCESVNAETYFDFADTGYVTFAEVNTNKAERIGPHFIPDPETGDEAAYPADTTLPRYTQSGLQILGLVTAVHGTKTPKEPATVQQALGGKHREKWREAMDKELKALKEHNTWKVVPIGVARNKTILTGKWVFRVKTKADGTIDKFKARWVVRGFDQEHGRDFTKTFAPVSRHTSLRILLAIAAMKKKKLRQINIANAFLYAPVDAEIYVELPHGSHGEPNQVCQMQKFLYGIKQAPRLWQQYLHARLTRIGFRQLSHDQGMYRLTKGDDYILLIVYVDDLLYIGSTDNVTTWFEGELQKDLTLTVSSTVTQYLGLNIQEGGSAIYLNAAKYADTIAKRFSLTPTTISTPYRYTAGNNKEGSAPLKSADIRNYQRKLGCLLFAAVTCRPDLSYSASQLATYLKRPEGEHMAELDRALHYLVSTATVTLTYHKNGTTIPKLVGYVDVDHANDPDNRRSRTGYIYRLEPIGPISWQPSKLELIALSSAQAEYIALCSATKEGLYLRELLEEAKLAQLPSFSLICDNQSAIRIANKNGFANRTKHIALRYFFVKDEIEKGRLELSYCPTSEMAADYLTKKLGKSKFEYCMLLTGQSHIISSDTPEARGSSEGLGFKSQCVHFGHPSAGRCQRSLGDPRLILGKGYRLVVLGVHGGTDPLLNEPYSPSGLVAGILTDSDQAQPVMAAPNQCPTWRETGPHQARTGLAKPVVTSNLQQRPVTTTSSHRCRSSRNARSASTPANVEVRRFNRGAPITPQDNEPITLPYDQSGITIGPLTLPRTKMPKMHTQGFEPETAIIPCENPNKVSGLPRSLPPLPPSPAPPCLPCVEGRQRVAPHSSSFPPTSAALQTLHMDVWGPARVSGQGRERYFLLVVDDYTRYTTVFSLRSKGQDLPVLRPHSDRGGEFSSNLLRDFCRGEGILRSFTLPDSPQQNGIAERRIGLVMKVARTSMIHAAAPHFLWPFAVRYAAHQLNLWPRVSLPETSPTLRWTGEVGDASVFR
ncbi:unnamed protein product, partial [Closterium sp. NIES-53]